MSLKAGHPFAYVAQVPAAVDAGSYLSVVGSLVERHGGRLLAAAAASDVECLERGTPAMSLVIAEFADGDSVRSLWADADHAAVFADCAAEPGTLVVASAGLPYAGLPDMMEIPTTASVTPPADRGPRAYMLIQGTTSDQGRMDQYRDVILPMLKEQGAYYTVFDIEGNVLPLAGEWQQQIFAISRWPDHAAGHAFWDSDRYQNTAIPLRTGAGRFYVHFCTGVAG